MWISSITVSVPSGASPISYFVSARIRPCAAAWRWPSANSAAAMSAARSNSFASIRPIASSSSRDTETSWSPFPAFVDGVRIAFGSFSFFFMPSGSVWPAKTREPDA